MKCVFKSCSNFYIKIQFILQADVINGNDVSLKQCPRNFTTHYLLFVEKDQDAHSNFSYLYERLVIHKTFSRVKSYL